MNHWVPLWANCWIRNISLGFDLDAANGNKIGAKLGEAYGWIEGAVNSNELGAKLGEAKVWVEGFVVVGIDLDAIDDDELGGKLGEDGSVTENGVMTIELASLEPSWGMPRVRRRTYSCEDGLHRGWFKGWLLGRVTPWEDC